MDNGYLDIPYTEMMRYLKCVKKKDEVCQMMPRGRFSIRRDGSIEYAGLVCSDMGGKSTGCAAEACTNCQIKKEIKYE